MMRYCTNDAFIIHVETIKAAPAVIAKNDILKCFFFIIFQRMLDISCECRWFLGNAKYYFLGKNVTSSATILISSRETDVFIH